MGGPEAHAGAQGSPRSDERLIAVDLDEASIARAPPDVEHERAVALYDLVQENRFALEEGPPGPYVLRLALAEKRLVFDIRDAQGTPIVAHILSLTPFRRIVRDYFLICESYFAAIKSASPSRIEAIDMGRRGVHDEGSRLVQERLSGKVRTDFATARRLFTLISILHWKG